MPYRVGLVGESHCLEAIGHARPGERVDVLHEVTNPYDDRALVVRAASGEKLGYVPRENWLQRAVHEEGKGCKAKILSIDDETQGVVIEVDLTSGGIFECDY